MTAWLLTWLWQGTAVALVVSAAFRQLPRLNAATRYLIWWGAFLALIWLGWRSNPYATSPDSVTAALGPPSSPTFAFQVPSLPPWAVGLVAEVWAVVALFKLLRILSGLHGLYRLKDACTPMLRSIEEQLPLWQEAKRHGRPVQLMFCDELSSAAVLGLDQPCIAFPRVLLEAVSAGELDQIVLHEYGHVQRRDDWVRLGQALLEAAVWIHPAARWMCRELNLEREVACDDWVISKTRAPKAYADCLSRVAENRRCPATPIFAPALFGGTGALFRRVDRLLDVKRNSNKKLSLVAASAGLCCLGMAVANLNAYSVIVERGAPPMPVLTVGAGGAVPVELLPASRTGRATASAVFPTPSAQNAVAAPDATAVRRSVERTRASGATPVSAYGQKKEPATVWGADNLVVAETIDETASAGDVTPYVEGRSFQSVGRSAASSENSVRQPVTGWQLAATAGVNIGKATSKAGVGIASTFSKVSVSLFGSF